MEETPDPTRVKSDREVNNNKHQSLMAEDAIVEIAGKTGTSKKWADTLRTIESFDPENPTPEQSAAMDKLRGEFGGFTNLVIEIWNAPGNVAKRLKNTN